MAKKKFNISPILALLAIVCGVVSICMMFVKSVNVVGYLKTEYPYSGLQATFGYTAEDAKVSQLNFSFMNLLPYILLVVAIVLAVMIVLKKSNNKLLSFVICGLLVASGILFFCEGAFTVLGDFFDNTITGGIGAVTGAEITVELATGAIVAAISSLVGGALMLVSVFTKSK